MLISCAARDTFRTCNRLYMMVNSAKKAATTPTQSDIPNIVAAMMQVVPNFLAHRTLLYSQVSLSAELSES